MQISKLNKADSRSRCRISFNFCVQKVEEIIILQVLRLWFQNTVSVALRSVKCVPFSVTVAKFNLTTVFGWYQKGGKVIHNCWCTLSDKKRAGFVSDYSTAKPANISTEVDKKILHEWISEKHLGNFEATLTSFTGENSIHGLNWISDWLFVFCWHSSFNKLLDLIIYPGVAFHVLFVFLLGHAWWPWELGVPGTCTLQNACGCNQRSSKVLVLHILLLTNQN